MSGLNDGGGQFAAPWLAFETSAVAQGFLTDSEIDRLIAEHAPLLTEAKLGAGSEGAVSYDRGASSLPALCDLTYSIRRRLPAMTTARLRQLQSIDEVAKACGLDAAQIVAYAEAGSQAALYTVLRIPKRGHRRQGTFRIVYRANSTTLSNESKGWCSSRS